MDGRCHAFEVGQEAFADDEVQLACILAWDRTRPIEAKSVWLVAKRDFERDFDITKDGRSTPIIPC